MSHHHLPPLLSVDATPILVPQGLRIQWGEIKKLCVPEDDRKTFVGHLAAEMLHNGYILDAIDLYDMADVRTSPFRRRAAFASSGARD